MKFLYTENVNDQELIKNIKCIQKNYNTLYLAVIGIGYHVSIKDYNICYIAKDKIDVNYKNDLAYQTNQCYITREFLMYLMLGDTMERSLQRSVEKIIIKSSIMQEINYTISKMFRREHDKNVYIYQIDINGKIQDEYSYTKFPDHTFILIKYKYKFYIIQSFYNAYSFNSLYGFIELEGNEVNEFFEIIQDYARIIKNPIADFQGLIDTNKKFSKYTGIDLDRHYMFMRPSFVQDKNPPHIKITSLKTTSRSFLKNIKNNINNIYKSIDLWILKNIENNELIRNKIEEEGNKYSALLNKKKNKNRSNKVRLYETHTNAVRELELLLCDPPNMSQFHLKYNLYDCFTPEAIRIATDNSNISRSISLRPGSQLCDLIEIGKTSYSTMAVKRSAIESIKQLTGYMMHDSADFGFIDPSCFLETSEPGYEYLFIIFEKMFNINMNKLKKKVGVCMGLQV